VADCPSVLVDEIAAGPEKSSPPMHDMIDRGVRALGTQDRTSSVSLASLFLIVHASTISVDVHDSAGIGLYCPGCGGFHLAIRAREVEGWDQR
jgi:hypothetical protein